MQFLMVLWTVGAKNAEAPQACRETVPVLRQHNEVYTVWQTRQAAVTQFLGRPGPSPLGELPLKLMLVCRGSWEQMHFVITNAG